MNMTEKSINQEKQQRINRTLVLQLLRQQKLASRADIASYLDYSVQPFPILYVS